MGTEETFERRLAELNRVVEPLISHYERFEAGEMIVFPAPMLEALRCAFREATAPVAPEAPPEGVTPAIQVWCDGSGTTAESSAGCGIVIVFPDGSRVERGYFLGSGTNNFAEATAILRAMTILRDEFKVPNTAPVVIHSDSQWAIGAITQPWNLNTNVELVESARAVLKTMPKVIIRHVKGHAGIEGNEAADQLAGAAAASKGFVSSASAARLIRRAHKAAKKSAAVAP